MHALNQQYFIDLLQEQTLKKLAFDKQLQLEFLNINEPEIDRINRQEYMKFLASRIMQIDILLNQWLDSVELDIDSPTK